jgi:hypothetical protein
MQGARGFLLVIVFALLARDSVAQPPPPTSDPPKPAEGAPLGRFHLGPFGVTPYIRVGTIGLDSNVFYSATDPRADFIASGGPGLDIALGLGPDGRFSVRGGIDYLYYARTPSLRRFGGDAAARIAFAGPRTQLRLEENYQDIFERPSLEVNDRVERTFEGTVFDFERRLGSRLRVRLGGMRSRTRTPDQDYLGTDLGPTLTRDTYRVNGELGYALSVKTWLVVVGDQQWDRFPLDHLRDADSNRLAAGFRTDDTALIAGFTVAGWRWFRPRAIPETEERFLYVSVNAIWEISPKTSLSGSYVRDLDFSAFTPLSGTPTVETEAATLRFSKQLVGGLVVDLFGRDTRFKTGGPIEVSVPGQPPVIAVRDDRAREGGVDLGYRFGFGRRFRAGIVATWTDRKSTISYFGIKGLLVGFSARYTPANPR